MGRTGIAVRTEVLGDRDIINEVHGPYNTGMSFSRIRITDTTFTGALSVRANSSGALSVRANPLQ